MSHLLVCPLTLSYLQLLLFVNIAIFNCIRCLTPNYEFNRVFEENDQMKLRTSVGTLRQLQQIWNAGSTKNIDKMKSKYGLNGTMSAFLIIPDLAEDFPNCFVPGKKAEVIGTG